MQTLTEIYVPFDDETEGSQLTAISTSEHAQSCNDQSYRIFRQQYRVPGHSRKRCMAMFRHDAEKPRARGLVFSNFPEKSQKRESDSFVD